MPGVHSETIPTKRHEKPRLLTRVKGLFHGAWRELAVPTERRVPFLDGLRAIAVLMVVNGHNVSEYIREHGPNAFTHSRISRDGGWLGVDLFFVLSGYFIGSQLWRELSDSGTISIKRFMIRRGLRIWPLYFFMFLMVTIFNPVGAAAQQHGWTDVVFLTNYIGHGIVEGSWSLCSEEQFYLLAPLALLLIGRRSMKAYRWGLAGTMGLVLVVRILTYVHLTGHFFGKSPQAFQHLYYPFHLHCDGLIAGLLLANLASAKKPLGGLLERRGLLILLSFVALAAMTALQSDVFPFTGLALFFSSLVWWGLGTQTKFLSQHIFYLISRLSFGMYLNHEYMLHFVVGRALPAVGGGHLPPSLATILGFVLLAIASMAVSVLTFMLVEHPFLVLRTSLLQRNVPHLVAH